jgi:hypothetical protein
MSFLKSIIAFFNAKSSPQNTTENKPKKRQIQDVVAGEEITVEWYKIKQGMGKMKCLNNSPETKKIWLQIRWDNYVEAKVDEYEKIIFDYNDKELANFNLLNQITIPKLEETFDIATLQKKMNEALEKEEYEKADELQKQINKLLKK